MALRMTPSILLVASASYGTSGVAAVSESLARNEFASFVEKFERSYPDDSERELRFQIFGSNLNLIAESNARNTYSLGVGPFADWTPEEFRSRRFGGYRPFVPSSNHTVFQAAHDATVASVDWTTKGAVSPVLDQGDCGDCWAFATTGLLEGAVAARGGKLAKLSEQQLVDCDDFADGCNGGGADLGVWWVQDNGLCSESTYPYKSGTSGKKGSCKKSCSSSIQSGAVSDFSYVAETEAALMAAVQKMPVAVGIEADKAPFQHYTGGVITGSGCGTDLDHNVLIVGYGELDGTPYWKVKNSWGPSWGIDNGYVLIERGASGKGGQCGILLNAVVPVFSAEVVV